MRKSKFSDQQIIGILKEIDGGVARGDVARKYGVSEQTLSRWRAKFGGLDSSQAQTLRALEEENSRLKHLVAELSLDKKILEVALRKNS